MLEQLRQAVEARFQAGEHVAHLLDSLYIQYRRQAVRNLNSAASSEIDGIQAYRAYVRLKIALHHKNKHLRTIRYLLEDLEYDRVMEELNLDVTQYSGVTAEKVKDARRKAIAQIDHIEY